MKVLMVTPSYHPITGGTETAVRILSTKLNKLGVTTDVMTFNMNRKWNTIWMEETENNGLFKVFRMPALNLSRASSVNPLELIKVHVMPKPSFRRKLEDYDIIHFHGEADMSFPLFSYFIRKPKIFHCHWNIACLPRFKGLFKGIFPRLADFYIAYRLELLLELGVPKAKGIVLPFGVDVDTFQPDEQRRLDNLVLFVGRMERSKGLHVLLEALSYLTIPTEVVIIGPRSDTDYAEGCTRAFERTKQGIHKVRYLGAMNENGLIPWYQKATVLARPDLSGFSGGLTSLEALACGTPVVGTGNHLIKNEVNGILVQPNDPREFAEALRRMLENKELRERCGKEGRMMIERYFSWDRLLKKLIRIYDCIFKDLAG